MTGGPPLPRLQARYSRRDPRGRIPHIAGYPDIEHNRLGVFWRPIIDITDSPYAALRLRTIIPVADCLADTTARHRSWFLRIGVPGLRRQVVFHAGLRDYDCLRPADLPASHRTTRWQSLVDLTGRFRDLEDDVRCLLVFHLAQLSLTEHVFELTGEVEPTGDPDHDRYAYEVARVPSRRPDRIRQAIRVFQRLADSAGDPLLALAACFQGIGRAMRDVGDTALAQEFADRGKSIPRLPDDWLGSLVRSRFHRAVAFLCSAQRRADLMHQELARAVGMNGHLSDEAIGPTNVLIAAENDRYILELQLSAACADGNPDEVRQLCSRLRKIDPHCVEAGLVIGDALADIGELPAAAGAYARTGDLGTSAGAIGWFRAGQCYEILGDRPAAIHAMGRCLELDGAAVEPRAYLARTSSRKGDCSGRPYEPSRRE
jgi:tetratricopeptide (TPR) repeat protein